MIRITGGAWKGRTLPGEIPAGVRPTSARVREAVFSMVGHDLRGWSMLDPCGGAGLMALEAASRGASPVTVVERNRNAVAAIRRSAERVGATLSVRLGDSRRVDLPHADFVYLDPPYADGVQAWLERVAPLVGRVLVAEARSGADWPERVGALALDRVREHGEAVIAVYRPGGEGEEEPGAGAPDEP